MREYVTYDDEIIDDCPGVSIEHADGTTECMEPACELPHEFHSFHVGCGELHPPCPCVPEEAAPLVIDEPDLLVAA